MLGWIVLFGLMAVLGIITFAVELPRPTLASAATSVVFVLLLAISLVTRFFRSRA